jgi:predicted TIM-barrel fold metal-dependent hydrolase
MLIDWHSHHTAPELVAAFRQKAGKSPKVDAYDSGNFDKRLGELDEAGIDFQLVCQGASEDADQLDGADAMEMARLSNDVLAERIAGHTDRFGGITALSLKNVEASVEEIERMASRGFRAVLIYPRVGGEMKVDLPELDPVFAKVSELGLPLFLHGSGNAKDPTLERLEDGGAGVSYAVLSDASVNECVMRMIAGGLFDRHPNLKVVIRSGGGGIPLLVQRMSWMHKGPEGQKRYSDIFLEHFLIDTASVKPAALPFLTGVMGSGGVVFGSDYCGGLGPLKRALAVVEEQENAAEVRSWTERTSRELLSM